MPTLRPSDLRSDTVTRPTAAMMEAMMAAPTGDDVYGEDPTVNRLQDLLAERFGHEAGLFCPSGTMANQMAINVHTQPGDEVIGHRLSHVYNYEGGGIARNSGGERTAGRGAPRDHARRGHPRGNQPRGQPLRPHRIGLCRGHRQQGGGAVQGRGVEAVQRGVP